MGDSLFDEQKVRDTYAWVRRCFEAYARYVGIRWELGLHHSDETAPEGVRPTVAILKRLEQCVSAFRHAGREAKARVDDVVWHAPAVVSEPVTLAFVKGSSWAEALVRLVLKMAERSKDWTAFEKQDEETQGYMLRVLLNAPHDLELIDSHLKIEAARLRDRALSLSAYERYGYVLVKLTAQSARLLKLLLDHQGRIVSFRRVEEHLWPAEARESIDLRRRRNSAMNKLRSELKALGLIDLRAGIVTQEGKGYEVR